MKKLTHSFILLMLVILSGSCRSPKFVDLASEKVDAFYFDADGTSEAPPSEKSFENRLNLPAIVKDEARVWLRYALPDDASFDRILARSCDNIKAIYQDDQKINGSDSIAKGDTIFAFANLRSNVRPSHIYLKVNMSEQKRFEISCKAFHLTTQNNAIWYYLVGSAPQIISAVLISFVGLLSLVLNFAVFSWALLFFGAHALLIGLFLVSGMDLANLFVTNALTFRTSLGFFIFITYLLFFEELIGSKNKIARKFAAVNVALCFLIQIIETLSPLFFKEKIFPNLLTVAMINSLFTLYIVFEAAAKQRPFARTLAIATAFLSVFVGIDIYNHYDSQTSFLLSPWAFLVMICFTEMLLLNKSIVEQTKAEQVRTAHAKKRNLELQREVDRRTEALSDQAKELELTHGRLEERVEILIRQKQQASEVAQEKDNLLLRITEIKKVLIPRIVKRLQKLHDNPSPSEAGDMATQIDDLLLIFDQSTLSTPDEKPKVNETIDVLSANKRYQRTFKSSIGGARLDLRMSETLESLMETMRTVPSRLIVVEDSFVERLGEIHELNPKATLVVFSEREMLAATTYQRQYPMLDQVLTLDLPKPILQKILLTHLMKLSSSDIFGIEKYLMWGSAIKERPLDMRTHSLDQWEGLRVDIEQAGLSKDLEKNVLTLAEALLEIRRKNLITSGQSEHHKLKQLRYGHDAHVFSLSVDLSGQIMARQDIIDFFQSIPDSHPLAIQLFEESHAIILNSNGHDRHELIVLLFQSNEEIPPAYFYTFISS
jgi:hypothetical protein